MVFHIEIGGSEKGSDSLVVMGRKILLGLFVLRLRILVPITSNVCRNEE